MKGSRYCISREQISKIDVFIIVSCLSKQVMLAKDPICIALSPLPIPMQDSELPCLSGLSSRPVRSRRIVLEVLIGSVRAGDRISERFYGSQESLTTSRKARRIYFELPVNVSVDCGLSVWGRQ